MEALSPETSVQGVPDPPALPPKSPLRSLRPAASLSALPLTTTSASSGAGPSSAPQYQPRRPPPIVVPPPPLLKVDSLNVHHSPSTGSRSTSPRSRSRSAGHRPSFTSSDISSNSDVSQSTPILLDTVSRLVLSDNPTAMAVASPMSTTNLISVSANMIGSNASASSSTPALSAHITKRTHALTELLSSERVYASDLAIVRHVHIPLALGQPPHFQIPPSNDASSSQHYTSSSDPPPMTAEDVRVIFSNIEEMAIFADAFAERIESHMGDALISTSDGASLLAPSSSSSGSKGGKDSIGELFLEVAPIIEQLYIVYITRHPLALSRLAVLTAPARTSPSASLLHSAPSKNNPTPPADRDAGTTGNAPHYSVANNSPGPVMAHPMKRYLTTTRMLTERHTNAWDLPSLLIKPVQRLLKYPLLLQTLISSTQDSDPSHPDLPSLIKAKDVLETIARDVNEARRRWEVVKAVLDGYGFGGPASHTATHHSSSAAVGGGVPSARPNTTQGPGSGGGEKLSTFAKAVNAIAVNGTPKRPSTVGQGVSRSSPFGRGKSSGGTTGSGQRNEDDIIPNPLSRIQSLKTKLKTTLTPSNFATPQAAVEAHIASQELQTWETRLKRCESVLREVFNMLVVEWSRSVRDSFGTLGTWAVRFGRALEDPAVLLYGGGRPEGCADDAVATFVEVVRGLLNLWADLDRTLQSTLHPSLTSLLSSLSRPLTLVQHSIALHPLHLQHLNTPYAKNRSPYLLSSSRTFLALQWQLRIEMPRYLELFDKGFAGVVIKISKLQARFWEECWSRWSLYAMGVGVDVGAPGMVLEDGTLGGNGAILLGGGMVTARRASAHSHSSTSASSANLQRRSLYATSSGGADAASSAVEKDAATTILAHFHDRYDAVETMVSELTLLQPRATTNKPRPLGESSREKDRERTKDREGVRASTSSSILLAATYEFLSPSGSSSRRSSSGSGFPGRERSNTTSSSLPPAPSYQNSMKVVTSPTSVHSSSTSLGSSLTQGSGKNAADWSAALHAPTSVNGPPLTPKELEKKERKKREKAEREAHAKLLRERAKTEKTAAKAAGRKSQPNPGSPRKSGFLSGATFGGGSGGNPLVTPTLPRRTSASAALGGGEHSEAYQRGGERERRPSKTNERPARFRSSPAGAAPSTSATPNLADRTRDVLFGLMPSATFSDAEDSPPPALPSLQQISPLGLSTTSGHEPVSPVMPGNFSIAPSSSDPVPPRRHPFASATDGKGSVENGTLPTDDNGLWESLFDASQQSYKFHTQGSSPGRTPSPISTFHQQQEELLTVTRSHDLSASTRSHRSSSKLSHRHHGKHGRSSSVPPPPAHGAAPSVGSLPQPNLRGPEIYLEEPRTPPSMYETLYVVTCVHPFHPPLGAIHLNMPFLSLEINDVVDILLEDGHPSTHPNLPIYVDDGDDCMLVGRDEQDNIGWCLASFVMPLL